MVHRKDRRLTKSAQRPRRSKNHGPPAGEPWIWLTDEMLACPAYDALSKSGHRVLSRVMREHMAHAGTANGSLIVTHADFETCGVRRNSITDAIRECECLGFIAVDRGRTYKGEREPNLYRLTWIASKDGSPASNDWKRVTDKLVETFRARRKSATQTKIKRAAARNVKQSAGAGRGS